MISRFQGQSLELFFIDGKPDGMLTAEVFGWTGHVLMTPRTQISDALARKEARHTGVYLLFGDQDGTPTSYIGEGEDIAERIKTHDAKRDWWTTAILVTTAANNLNKAHIKYLEARLIQEARAVGKIRLENANSPSLPSLSEAAICNMESFLEKIFVVLPALRIDAFLKNIRPTEADRASTELNGHSSTEFELSTPKHSLTAKARFEDGEFVVLKGSLARSSWEGTPSHPYARLFEQLVQEGVLVRQNDHSIFTASYAFNSPSAAGAVVNGRATNGQTAWKLIGTNKTYREWEADQILLRWGGEPADFVT